MNADSECIFCKIVGGEIPSLRLFEDDHTFAFLDIGPLAEGHVLVVPKKHYVTLAEMPPDLVAANTRHLPRLARAVTQGVSADGCNILQNNGRVAGQEVAHVHWHIIPRVAGDGLGYRWNASSYAQGRDQQVLQQILAVLQEEKG